MENEVFENITISTTSNKTDGQYKQEVPTKTLYITTDDETAKKLEEFGLTKYTSKDEGEDFFILKAVDKLRFYFPDGTNQIRQDYSHVNFEGTDTLNYRTADGVTVAINVVKGENLGNEFYRLQAILIDSLADLDQIEPENPFENLS